MTKELKIIEALGREEDDESIEVLEDLGTNSPREDVREETAKALIRKNNEKALRIVVANKGKGVNDLSTKVAITSVNSLLALDDKEELLKIIDDTISYNSEEEVKNTARSIRALINLSN